MTPRHQTRSRDSLLPSPTADTSLAMLNVGGDVNQRQTERERIKKAKHNHGKC